MRNFAIRAMVLSVALLSPSLVRAQVIDQSYDLGSFGAYDLTTPPNAASSAYTFGQTFTASDNDIVDAAVLLHSTATDDDFPLGGFNVTLTYQLYDAPNGTALSGVETVTTGIGNGASKWVEGSFSEGSIPLTAGVQYFLKFQTNTGANGDFVNVADDDTDGYTGGGAYFDNSQTADDTDALFSDTVSPASDDCGQSTCDSEDFGFREYATSANVSATPEPGSLALLATGLIGTAGVVRRRRRKA